MKYGTDRHQGSRGGCGPLLSIDIESTSSRPRLADKGSEQYTGMVVFVGFDAVGKGMEL